MADDTSTTLQQTLNDRLFRCPECSTPFLEERAMKSHRTESHR
ncbi:hypothetical protein [Halococcus hamelinensis]|nr:hypothetical protein [Halococcus hamelinensis]